MMTTISNNPNAEPIARAIDAWSDQECLASVSNQNAMFDDLGAMRQQMSLSADDPNNYLNIKHSGHHNRQRLFGEAVILSPGEDSAVARYLYNSLAQISGIVKRMHYMRARNAADYMLRKLSGCGSGINTLAAVDASLAQHADHYPTPEEANDIALEAFVRKGEVLDQIRARVPEDFGKENSPAIVLLEGVQINFIHAVSSGILMAITYRDGELSRVPFLEPKAIGDADIFYPFAN